MSVDHVKLDALRADLSLRPFGTEAVRPIRALLAHGSAAATPGSAEYGALRRLELLGLAEDANVNQDEGIAWCWYRRSAFLEDLAADGRLREFWAI